MKLKALFPLIFVFAPLCLFAQHKNSETARHFTDLLEKGNYTEASKLLQANPPTDSAFWANAWSKFIKNYGHITEERSLESDIFGKYDMVYRIVDTEKKTIKLNYSFENGNLTGFRYQVYDTANAHHAIYANPLFKEKKLRFQSGNFSMSAALLEPAVNKDSIIVIFVHGSGSTDRDESVGGSKVFLDLAQGLASYGIASFRFDKRSYVYPEAFSNRSFTVYDETVQDAVSAVDYCHHVLGYAYSNIFVLGHSLGGMLAPRIANSIATPVGGIIIFSGNARALQTLIGEQTEYLMKRNGKLTKEDKKRLVMMNELNNNVSKLQTGDAAKNTLALPSGLPASYWYDLKNYDQCKTAASLDIPILVMQGGRDYQVTTEDFLLWKKALKGKANASFMLFNKLNHLYVAGESKSYPEEYEKPGNVDKSAIEAISDWLKLQEK
ncbi:MAG TPA: alpha/beta fold hydrolase [Bacteroidales bacterium]|nr:alpha/beta fold hydrolase [Bacteroidales bacterium]HQP03453.1 alpha/beta fold hydrolase [Bacteroidales bacterium]